MTGWLLGKEIARGFASTASPFPKVQVKQNEVVVTAAITMSWVSLAVLMAPTFFKNKGFIGFYGIVKNL